MSEQIRITIEDDAGDGSPKAANSPKRSIEELERESEASRAETARLLAEAARHRLTAARLKISSSLISTDGEAQAAQSQYRDAVELGDVDAQTAAQARMAEVEARRVRLIEHDHVLQNTPMVPSDPVEAMCAGRTEPTARWLREHPDWVRDPRKNAKLTAAHFDAEADGLVPDTPEYFARIEKQIGIRGNGRDGGNAGGTVRNGGVHPADFNPADVSTHIRDGGREVVLTKGEAKAASDGTLVWNYGPLKGQPIGTQEAARRKAAMFAQGRYNRLD